MSEPPNTIDELLDHAVQAINTGDRMTASALAEQVLTIDGDNQDAEDLLASPAVGGDVLRRMTILFADVVDSTALSTRIEPETYRTVIGRYRQQVNAVIDRYEGHVSSTKGDGLLAVFGHPKAHENDVRRAVQAGLDITRDVAALSERVRSRFGFDISVRVGVHRGLVYLDVAQDDVYGLGANLAARVAGLAPPGCVVVSAAIAPLVAGHFELDAQAAQPVKGIDEPVEHYRVIEERIGRTRTPLRPLVGRDLELARLQDAWNQAKQGTLTVPGVCFSGEAGMGKSRLATAAADLAEQAGRPALALIGSPFQADAGLYPIRALLEQRCGIERTTAPAARMRLLEDELQARGFEPAAAVPLLAPVLGIAAEHGYQPVQAEGTKLYQQIIEAIVGYLHACAGSGPAVVLAEDLQWFDASTLDVIAALLGANTGRLLVVLTARETRPLPTIAAHIEVFDLAPLTPQETDQLIATLDPALSGDERAEVKRRCDGVPLYIEEVVAKFHEQPTDAAGWARAPDALYEPLFSRLRASDTTIQVVEAAATIGREFDRAILASVVEMTETGLDEAIQALAGARVFLPAAKDRWRFRHELLREVAYELPPPSVRRTLHGRAADAIVATSDNPDWHLVALHYEHAQRFDAAADAHRRAASDARLRGAINEARANLTRAISQIERATPAPVRDGCETNLRLERAFLTTAVNGPLYPEVSADLERCLQLANTSLREEDRSATLATLWAYYLTRGDLRRCLQLAKSSRLAGQSWFRSAYGTAALFGGDFNNARSALELVAGVLAATNIDYESVYYIPCDPITSVHTHLALTRFVQGDLAGAEDQLAATVRRVARLGFPQGPFSLGYQRFYQIWMAIETGQLDLATDIADESAVQVERHGFEYAAMLVAIQRATIRAVSALSVCGGHPGALQPHIDAMSRIVEQFGETEWNIFASFYHAVLARLLIAAGRTQPARESLTAALQAADDTGVNFYRAELFRLRAQTLDDADAHEADLCEAISTARAQGATIFELRAAMDDVEMRGETATGALQDAINRLPADSAWPELSRARALIR
ncbi:adenylate/guanylate cyclase domain-containing protein [Mycolicibacter virginiensis]|uniref:Adenylate/guanylate cyclase domain-containing protein n=1 Tax=Mycolicibacter virginiensis TaxID=1795032 RepID=A0A9X7NYW3_9MYCO|nr:MULTISPECIES: adenylate/guanylate cyclase domain-containing protein [Mycobacteriaceae]PQM52432.1 adenylate/guanylate cyclase domain-containing protein [Mycolicibacter virginiensis]